MGNQLEDSVLIQSLPQGHALEFERSDPTRKLRLLLSELLVLVAQVNFPSIFLFFTSNNDIFINEE